MTKGDKMAKDFVAPQIYHDQINIYLDWVSYVQKFPYTEAGLSKALKTIPHIASHPGYVTGRSNLADKLLDKRGAKIARNTKLKREIAKATEGQRRSASEAIRKMRIKESQS
jgi:hypothetical protein